MAKEIKIISCVKGSARKVRNLPALLPLLRSLVQYDNAWFVQEERKRGLRAKTAPEKAGEISEDEKGVEENA